MVVELDRSNRYEPYVVGFINFWAYKNEEYPFYKGNILFRGQNGQGKSVSMQSIIPLLLDGNTHPSRIDPFGSGKRKIGDYLRTNDALDKGRIAYLYISYKKIQTGEVITTGIGLRALDESKNDFWGFVVKDREVRKNFPLTKSIGFDKDGQEEFVPLPKDELKANIEQWKCGRFVTTQKEYVEEVNKQLFQFENVELFKELTKLLIQIRSPKLSKEMKPDVLYEALKKSLGELPSSDFSMISNTIQDIDNHNRKLKNTQTSLELSQLLLEAYEKYQQATIGNSASRYLQYLNEHRDKKKSKETQDKKLIAQNKDLLKVSERLQEIAIALETKNIKLGLLETSGTRSLRDEKQSKTNDKNKKEQEHQKKTDQLTTLKKKGTNFKKDMDAAEEKASKFERDIKDILLDLDGLASEIQFHEGDSYLKIARENLQNPNRDKSYFGVWLSRLESHIESLKEVMEAIKEEERLYDLLWKKKNEIKDVESDLERVEKALLQLEKEFETIKSNYKVALGKWVAKNKEMTLPPKMIGEIVDIAENLYDFSDMTPKQIDQILYDQKETLLNPLKEEAFKNIAQIELKRDRITELTSEQQKLENEKEVVPFFRRPETIDSRKKLENQNVPFVPFYEAVEFLDGVTDTVKERIESALLDMGILDGLIVPDEYTTSITENDAIIVPQKLPVGTTTLDQVLKPIVPDHGSITAAGILNVLKSISLVTLAEGTYVTTNGEYQHGMVKGYAVQQSQSSFIGKEARRRHRERKIEELKQKIQTLQDEIGDIEGENEELESRKTQLLTEYENRPNFDGLDKNREDKDKQILQQIDLEDKKGKLTLAHDDLTASYQEAKFKKIQASNFLEGQVNIETVGELLSLSQKDYQSIVHTLERTFNEYQVQKNAYSNAKTNFEENEEYVQDVKGDINVLHDEIQILKQSLIDIEALLKSAGAEEEEQEIEKLRSEIEELEKEERAKMVEQPDIKHKIQTTTEQIEKAKKELVFLQKQLDIQEEVFGLELKNNRIEYEKSLEKVALEYKMESDISEAQKEMDRAVMDFRSKDLEGYLPSSQEIMSGTNLISIVDFPDKADRIQIINSERQRLRVTLLVNGSKKNPKEFYDYLKDLETQQRSFLKQDEETLIKKVMIQGIGEKIKDLIGKAMEWKNDINAFMKSLNNSIELRLLWEPIDKNDKNAEDHLTTSQLVALLGRDFSTLRDTDIEALSRHFMSKINLAKERLNRKNTSKEDTAENLEQALKQVLDYRDWYKFKILYTLEGGKEKVLDEKNLNILSGGEKAMAIYIPLFSAAYSKYNTSSPDAPYIIALDEAFAGVDEENISEMFSLMERLVFNYILTSQALWADYPTVSGINIYELSYDKVEQYVFSEPWRWDGKKLEFNEEVLFDKGIAGDEEGELHGDPVQESLFDFA